ILDQGLSDKRGYLCAAQFVGNIEMGLQPVREAHFLDTQVKLLKPHFLDQRNDLFGVECERRPQEIGQVFRHDLRLLAASARNQADDGIEGVEKEMGIELIAKGPDVGRMSEGLKPADELLTLADVRGVG